MGYNRYQSGILSNLFKTKVDEYTLLCDRKGERE